MKKQDYYENKVLYALNKIEYAKQRMGVKDELALSKLYAAMMLYGGRADVSVLMRVSGLGRDVVVRGLRELRSLGIADWGGKYLRSDTPVVVERDKFRDWYLSLQEKLKGDVVPVQEVPVAEVPVAEWVEVRIDDSLVLRVTKERLKKALW